MLNWLIGRKLIATPPCNRHSIYMIPSCGRNNRALPGFFMSAVNGLPHPPAAQRTSKPGQVQQIRQTMPVPTRCSLTRPAVLQGPVQRVAQYFYAPCCVAYLHGACFHGRDGVAEPGGPGSNGAANPQLPEVSERTPPVCRPDRLRRIRPAWPVSTAFYRPVSGSCRCGFPVSGN